MSKLGRIKNKLRTYWYKKQFLHFGKGACILGKIFVLPPKNVSLGDFSFLNEGVYLNAREKITIGSYVHISPFCIINTGKLDYTKKFSERSHIAEPVIIEDGVWIGSGVIINPGVIIGKNSVVGSGAVVTKNIPPNSLAVGVPAKVVREI